MIDFSQMKPWQSYFGQVLRSLERVISGDDNRVIQQGSRKVATAKQSEMESGDSAAILDVFIKCSNKLKKTDIRSSSTA